MGLTSPPRVITPCLYYRLVRLPAPSLLACLFSTYPEFISRRWVSQVHTFPFLSCRPLRLRCVSYRSPCRFKTFCLQLFRQSRPLTTYAISELNRFTSVTAYQFLPPGFNNFVTSIVAGFRSALVANLCAGRTWLRLTSLVASSTRVCTLLGAPIICVKFSFDPVCHAASCSRLMKPVACSL